MTKFMRMMLPCGFVMVAGLIAATAHADDMVQAKDGSGVFGYRTTPVLPWCGFHVHDPDRPLPRRVDPGPAATPAPVPSDAVLLFGGKDLAAWESSDWKLVDDCVETGSGNFASKQSFGNCQIHLEWISPAHFEGPWYNQGNNGVMLMGLYEIQIFDSLNVKIYPDGMAGAIYGQTPPLVNACRPPGEWQSFDIAFTAPVFESEKLLKPARVTVFQNGVLVQNDEEIHGETGHAILAQYTQKKSQGPLLLYGHGCPVRFRNIWVRPL